MLVAMADLAAAFGWTRAARSLILHGTPACRWRRGWKMGLFGIGFGELDAVTRIMHVVDTDNAALVARFKYMQRMGFPEGVNTGRGTRSVYDLEKVLKVLVAFELLETGATPTRVVRMVRTGWASLMPALIVGWLSVLERGARPRRLMLCARLAAFRELGQAEDPDQPVEEPLRPMPLDGLMRWMEAADEPLPADAADVVASPGPGTLVIDPMRLVSRLRSALPAVSASTLEDIDRAFASLGAEVFDGAPRAAWTDDARRRLATTAERPAPGNHPA